MFGGDARAYFRQHPRRRRRDLVASARVGAVAGRDDPVVLHAGDEPDPGARGGTLDARTARRPSLTHSSPTAALREIARRRRTQVLQRARGAARRRRLADLAAQTDEADVQRRAQAVGDQIVQQTGRRARRTAFAGMMPNRFVTRCTCVSTGIASRPSAKLKTTAAVLGPIPGSEVRYARASASDSSRSRSRLNGSLALPAPPAGSPGYAAPSCSPGRRCGSHRPPPCSAPRRPAARSGMRHEARRTRAPH